MKLWALALLAAWRCAGADAWTVVESPHFELFTSGNPAEGRDAIVFFEQVHDLFASWKAKESPSFPRVKIIVFGSDQDYRIYQPNQLAAAFFLSGSEGDFIVTKNLTRETYPVAVHEYVHLVVKRSGLRMTTAMNEGLAEFYSTLKVTRAGIEIGRPPVARLLTLRYCKLFPLATLFAVGRTSPVYQDRVLAEAFYAESWALTHMLLLSPEYRDKTTSYARDMQGPDPLADLERITGKPATRILEDLAKYTRRDRFVTALLDGRWDGKREVSDARRATRYEWGMALAGLLDSEGRHAEARERYAALAADGPEGRK
jgi:hypothetical protein